MIVFSLVSEPYGFSTGGYGPGFLELAAWLCHRPR